MQWLNKLDSVLDNVLIPRNNNDEQQDSTIHNEDATEFDADEYYRHSANDGLERDFDNEDEAFMLEFSNSSTGVGVGVGVDSDNNSYDAKNQNEQAAAEVGQITRMRGRDQNGTGKPGPGIRFPGVIRPVLREHGEDSSCDSDEITNASMNFGPSDANTNKHEHGHEHNGNTSTNSVRVDDYNQYHLDHKNPSGSDGEPDIHAEEQKQEEDKERVPLISTEMPYPETQSPAPLEIQTLALPDNFHMSPLLSPPPILQSISPLGLVANRNRNRDRNNSPNDNIDTESNSVPASAISVASSPTPTANNDNDGDGDGDGDDVNLLPLSTPLPAQPNIPRPPKHAFLKPFTSSPSIQTSASATTSTSMSNGMQLQSQSRMLEAKPPPPPPIPAEEPSTMIPPLPTLLASPPPPPPLSPLLVDRFVDVSSSSSALLVCDEHDHKNEHEHEHEQKLSMVVGRVQKMNDLVFANDNDEDMNVDADTDKDTNANTDTNKSTNVNEDEDLKVELNVSLESEIHQDEELESNDEIGTLAIKYLDMPRDSHNTITSKSSAQGLDEDTSTTFSNEKGKDTVDVAIVPDETDVSANASSNALTKAVETASSFIPTNIFGGLMQTASFSKKLKEDNRKDKKHSRDGVGNDGEEDKGTETQNDTLMNLSHESDIVEGNTIEGIQATFGDFMPVGTFQEESFEDDDSVMTSITEKEGEDYQVHSHNTWEDDGLSPFEPWMNCHGVVYVRLLRVQHLPCAKNSALQAIYSLPPWKGRIRSEKVTTYQGPSQSGICARWDRNVEKGSKNDGDGMDENSNPCISMVHTYNDYQSPVPNISIILKDMAFILERELCSLSLSCEPLMKKPGIFRRQWCKVSEDGKNQNGSRVKDEEGSGSDKKMSTPMILIEACFEPTDFGDNKRASQIDYNLEGDVAHENGNDQNQRERLDTLDTNDGSTFTKATRRGLKSKPHMFINYSSLRPTYCALCSTIIMWKFKGYQCETCKLDCCADCQLRVDVEMPCGSDKAKDAVNALAVSKLSLTKMYEVVAPKKEIGADKAPMSRTGNEDEESWRDGVGTMILRINKACLLKHNFSPEAGLDAVLEAGDRWSRSGDYYARVSWTNGSETKRTKTVFQSANPRFDSDDIVITSMHYGTEFKIEVVDAMTDRPVGTKILTTQGLLQWQRDNIGWGLSPESIYNPQPLLLNKKAIRMELRSGVGFGLDFYKTAKLSETSRAGEISGWIDVDITFQENPDLYSNSRPRPYPPRPADDFNIELIQLHIARITSLIEDLNGIMNSYLYLVSWKNPTLTSLSLIIFVFVCLKFSTEYIGSLPFILLIAFMLRSGRKSRSTGGFKARLIKKETEAKLKEMRGTSVKYKTHRPIGNVEISVLRGKNLVPHHGIPGSLVSSIVWNPLKFADENVRESIMECDPASNGLYNVGETEGSGVTSTPEWKVVHSSNELERMKQLLPSKNFLSRTNSSGDFRSDILTATVPQPENVLHFPILQPILPLGERESSTDDTNTDHVHVLPWETTKGAIIIQVRFADVLNKLPIFDQVLGDVVIPMSRVAQAGNVEGWFQVLEKGTSTTMEIQEEDPQTNIRNNLTDIAGKEGKSVVPPKALDTSPSIYLSIKFKVPSNNAITDIDKETSMVVAEHLIRSANSKTDNGIGFFGTSINTFNTVTGVRGNLQYLQNQLGDILDMIEIILNAFNFTCPDKSGILLVIVSLLWLVLILVPTRYVILLGGLGQYAATFFAAYQQQQESRSKDDTEEVQTPQTKAGYDPYMTRIQNFFFGIPTNEDLRRYFFWEAIKVGEREREIVANKKRAARLTKLWKAQWFGKLELKIINHSATASDERKWDWKSIFSIVQGHRFIWWDSESAFDEGENPSGQIYFAGHSGLAGLSPLELRELKQVEVPLTSNVFGRGVTTGGQQTKISLLSPDQRTKEGFEAAVLNATLDKLD